MAKIYALLSAASSPPMIFFIFWYLLPLVVFSRSHMVFTPPKFLYSASFTSKWGTSVVFYWFWGFSMKFRHFSPSFESENAEYGCFLQQLIITHPFQVHRSCTLIKIVKISQNGPFWGSFLNYFGQNFAYWRWIWVWRANCEFKQVEWVLKLTLVARFLRFLQGDR